MRALTISDGRLVVAERPDPTPGPGDVLVRVHGAGLNRADLLQRAGGYPAPPGVPADIPGLEFAGEVAALGPGTSDLAVGDRVFGITAGGAQAELVCVPAEHCAPVPARLDPVTAGGVPEAFVTAHDALVTQSSVRPDEWVFVPAVGSGVGTAAIQLIRAVGARAIGTARSAPKLDRCRDLGLEVGFVAPLDAHGSLDATALVTALLDASGGVGVTLDLVGGSYLRAAIDAAAPGGRIVCIGTLAGLRTEVSVLSILTKRLRIAGTVLRPRSRAEKADATAAFARDVVPLIAAGTVAPVVDRLIPLDRAAEGYDLMAADATFGKVVIDCR
ncbi:MAG: NAD(P)H-quinone oxidoreductase [Actinomycetota bacterium]